MFFGSWHNRHEYAALVEDYRLKECHRQTNAIAKGLRAVVPEAVFHLFTGSEIELVICGKPTVDIKVLKEHTVYQGFSEKDPCIQYFWETLEEFSNQGEN